MLILLVGQKRAISVISTHIASQQDLINTTVNHPILTMMMMVMLMMVMLMMLMMMMLMVMMVMLMVMMMVTSLVTSLFAQDANKRLGNLRNGAQDVKKHR